jgi:hypothetical protein
VIGTLSDVVRIERGLFSNYEPDCLVQSLAVSIAPLLGLFFGYLSLALMFSHFASDNLPAAPPHQVGLNRRRLK